MNNKELFEIGTNTYIEVSNNCNGHSLVDKLKNNKLVLPYLHLFRESRIDGLSWNDWQIKIQNSEKELLNFVSILNSRNIPYLHLKGLALTGYYPEIVPRQSADYDFLIKDINDYWLCHDILVDLGFELDYFPMFSYKDNKVYGLVNYKKTTQGADIFLELNIGGFIIAEVSWLDFSGCWENRKYIEISGTPINIPNDTYNLAILILESCDRKKFQIRDAVDYYYITKNGEIDFSLLKIILNDKFLWEVLNKLDKFSRDLKAVNVRSFKRYTQHIIPNFEKKKFIKQSYYFLLKSFGESNIKKNKYLNLIKKFDYIMSPKSRFENSIVTTFILMDQTIKGDWQWFYFKNYSLVLSPIGVLWATNFSILSEDEEDEMRKYISTLQQHKEFQYDA